VTVAKPMWKLKDRFDVTYLGGPEWLRERAFDCSIALSQEAPAPSKLSVILS